MTTHSDPLAGQRPLRLWPGVALAVILVPLRYLLPLVAGDAEIFGVPLSSSE